MEILPFNFSRRTLGLYIHYPFCKRLCRYCDFLKYPYNYDLEKRFTQSLRLEFELWRDLIGEDYLFETVYLGGGSPSLAGSDFFEVISIILNDLNLVKDPEISIEINPEDLNDELVSQVRHCGFNRLSIGIQSFLPEIRKFLGREFDPEKFRENFRVIRKKFDNVSFDILMGFENELEKRNINTLYHNLTEFKPEHISLYILTGYPGTEFFNDLNKKSYFVDSDMLSEKLEEYEEKLSSLGYSRYEVSSYSKPGKECRHNLNYWRFGNYISLGPSASGKLQDLHFKNFNELEQYFRNLEIQKLPIENLEHLDFNEIMEEIFFLKLRTKEFVSGNLLTRLEGRLSHNLRNLLGRLADKGLIYLSDAGFRMTSKGLNLSEEIFVRLFMEQGSLC